VPWRGRESIAQAVVELTLQIHKTIGLAHPYWSPAIEVPGQECCEVCGGWVDDPVRVCLACSRSGLDGWLPPVFLEKSVRPSYKPGPLRGGIAGLVTRWRSRRRRNGYASYDTTPSG
jgi:hypothetical protein